MVSLEESIIYQKRINSTPKLKCFSLFLQGKLFPIPEEFKISETDSIYFGALKAIQQNSKKDFISFYNKKNKSNPTDEFQSPFVSDDFLIFCFILGIIKFDLDKEWITRILSLRKRSVITSTFENLLTENYYSKTNQPEIIFAFLNLIDFNSVTNELLNSVSNSVIKNEYLFDGKNDFLSICSLYAYNELIKLSLGNEAILLKSFKETFIKKLKVLTWCIIRTKVYH